MKAINYQKFGNIDVLQTVEEPKPSVQSNQVLVKVKAVSVNPLDWKIRKGEMKLMSGSKSPGIRELTLPVLLKMPDHQ